MNSACTVLDQAVHGTSPGLSNLLENLTQPLLGTGNVPRPYSLNARSFAHLALPCIMLLCTPGFEFISAA